MYLIERLINKDYLTERERKEWLGTIKERLEMLEQENKELKETIEIRKQMNINLIDFGTKLKQENEKLKKAIEILKDFFDFDIYAGEGKGYIDCCVENPTFDLYNDTKFKEFELLKEVLGE